MSKNVHFSSDRSDWATPLNVFESLNRIYGPFTLDPCADDFNHKCDRYYTINQDGLLQSWENEIVFCNPPYGRSIGKWVRKCYLESLKNGAKCVMLIPARTDTRWFHDYIYYEPNVQVIFLKGRLKFEGAKNSAPFPSMIVVFEPCLSGGEADGSRG